MKNWINTNRYRLSSEEESEDMQYQPIIINSSQESSQPSAGLAVVENKVFFYGEINDDTIIVLNKTLLEMDIKLQNAKNILGEECVTPIIHLRLNTGGGSISSAFSTVDIIRNLKSKVYTYVDGYVASAGTLISGVGHKRFIGEHGQMLIHQLSGEMYGKYSEMEDQMFNCSIIMKRLKDFYKKYTKIPMKKLDELLKKDIILNPEECLQCGLVDEII